MDAFARFVEVDSAFEAALTLGPEERTNHLASLRAFDPWLATRVQALLEAADEADAFMHAGGAFTGAFGDALSGSLESGEPEPVASIGQYEIVREIGRGGMSVVYLARRADADFERVVAIKVLKRGLDTEDLLRRFSQERRILASFEHPAIARLFDGGATEDGRPYIVMEYVKGASIDQYCTERRLALTDRLRLFLEVAGAVEYAHRNLIVHRDLKPGNVLVSNGERVTLLDFGIAKLLDDSADGPSTRPAQRFLTPEYATPEQLRGEPITTASDVYQLGLLLYELAAGRRPDRSGREGEILPPPSLVARAADPSTTVDADLDSVILMALQHDPVRRYASVREFAEDVERYLSSQPVRARTATLGYRVRKFVRRHPAGVAMSAAFAVATVVYASVLTVQARALTDARDRAQASAGTARQVAQFMVDVFTLANPTEGEGTTVTARQLLDRGTSRLETELGDHPLVLAEMLRSAGKSYFGLGLNGEAERLLRRSVALLRHASANPEALASALTDLGRVRYEQGEATEARTLLTEGLVLRRSGYDEPHQEIAESLHNLGRVEAAAGNYGAAERLFREALTLRERLIGRNSLEAAQSLHGLGVTLQAAGNYSDAEPALREALRVREGVLGINHPGTTDTLNALGLLLRDRGRAADALPLLQRALDANRTRLGVRHPYVATNMNNLALVLRDLGRQDAAEPLYRGALDILRTAYGHDHPRVAVALFNLAAVLQDLRNFTQAETLYREALEIDRRRLGDDHLEVAVDRTHLGRVLHLKGETKSAEPLLRQALARLRQVLAPDNPRLARGALALGELLADTDREREAEPLLREAAATYRDKYGRDDPRTIAAVLTLGRATSTLGRFAEMDAITVARCQPVTGRYRGEVAQALEDLLRIMEKGTERAAVPTIRNGAVCGGGR